MGQQQQFCFSDDWLYYFWIFIESIMMTTADFFDCRLGSKPMFWCQTRIPGSIVGGVQRIAAYRMASILICSNELLTGYKLDPV